VDTSFSLNCLGLYEGLALIEGMMPLSLSFILKLEKSTLKNMS